MIYHLFANPNPYIQSLTPKEATKENKDKLDCQSVYFFLHVVNSSMLPVLEQLKASTIRYNAIYHKTVAPSTNKFQEVCRIIFKL